MRGRFRNLIWRAAKDTGYVAFIVSLFALLGCTLLKARPAPDSGFLPHGDKLAPITERSPLHGTWFSDREKFYEMKRVYTKVVMLPVDTKYLESKIRKERASDDWKTGRLEDLHEIARYMEQRFKNAIEDYPNHPWKVTEEPGAKTFVLETAIVELTPTSPFINTVGTAASFFVPGGGLIKYAGTGSIAMEAILRDGETGAPLVEFKDRQTDKASPVSIKDYQMFAHSRATVDDWSKIFAELAATPYEHKVEGPLPFTLNPL